jgi:hypothetical protein
MRKKCVRWAKPVLAILTIISAVGLHGSNGTLSAQSSPDPLTLPRLEFANLTYLGGFRLPSTGTGDTFNAGGSLMAFNPARNSLFINTRRGNVAEVTIPNPINSSDVTKMPFASYLQAFRDPTEGHFHEIAAEGAALAGLVVHGDRLYGTGSIYYDASNSQVLSHFSHSTDLAQPSFVGMSQVWETGKTGYVAGYLANVPSEWQSALGGPALTGQCCIPIVTRTSFGPAAFAWDPATIGRNTAVPATPLLYYTQSNATLGRWDGANPTYGGTTMITGLAVIAGTRTALFVGRNGLGTFCYGHGTSNASLAGTKAPDGEKYCYDPTSGDKGQHAYPYAYQIWAYDLADLAAVRAGSKQPWEVVPYATWPFEFPTIEPSVRTGGVAYDAERQLLYISQWLADRDGYSYRPIVHTLKINVPGATPAIERATVTLTADKTAPQAAGTSIRWSAATTGNSGPSEFQWASYAGGVWTVAQNWSASSTFDWQPLAAAADARVSVSVRAATTRTSADQITADGIIASAQAAFPIADSANEPHDGDDTSTAVSAVTLTSNLAAPQPVSSTIVWTASPAGGANTVHYKWFISADGGNSWTSTGPWSTASQLPWTPTTVNANYRVAVWVKRATNDSGEPEASAEKAFAIGERKPETVSSVTLASNVASPQAVSSNVVWTAAAASNAGALSYKWFLSNDGGGSWTSMGSWASSNQFAWTPTVANANYRIAVWVKHASNTSDSGEAASEQAFAITERAVASLTLTANVASPQPLSTTIQWTATQAGGTGAIVYKWFISNDGGGSWTSTGPWTSSHQLTWTPAAVGANYRVAVWGKRASNSNDSAEATAETPFAIIDRAVSSVALASNVASPQPLSSTITWTATPTGATGALVYKWFISGDGGTSWTSAGPWVASHQLTWTPTAASSTYRVAVWVKRASNAADSGEASAEAAFAITNNAVASVTMMSNLVSPQPLASIIEWTATPVGGSGALLYKWFISEDDGASWTSTGPWALSNRLRWTPTAVNPKYRVAVWVKRATNPSDSPEAVADSRFSIIGTSQQ